MRDSKARSWAKSVLWRIIGVFLLGGIAYVITGDWLQVTLITAIFHIIRVILYYYHERAWETIGWGRNDENRPSEGGRTGG